MSTISHGEPELIDPRPAAPRELQEVIFAERAGKPFVLVRAGATGPLVVRELEGTEMVVGRNDQCGIVLGWDRRVSSAHFRLMQLGSEWSIEDDDLSRNGTFVNGARVRGRQRLRDADVIRAGRTLVRYRDPRSKDWDSTEFGAELPDVGQVSEAERKVLVALCRPIHERRSPVPAPNQEIAEELFLGLDAVKSHLRHLFARFGLASLPRNEKRARLAEVALESGLVTKQDFER